VASLQSSLSILYGDKDAVHALPELLKTAENWDGPKVDLGAIYRCAGDAAMEVRDWGSAKTCFNNALEALNGDDGEGEVGYSTLGLARSRKALGDNAGLGEVRTG